MSTSNRHDVNAALTVYRAATDSTRPALEQALIQSMEHYATRIVSKTLKDNRPDIVNHVVQMAIAQLEEFKGTSKYSTYFYAIAQRACFEELRRKINNRETPFSDLEPEQVEGLAHYELDGDSRMMLDDICKTLSAQEQLLINLKLQGYTNGEIAQLRGSTPTAIASRWGRLRSKLREAKEKSEQSYLTKRQKPKRKLNK